MRQAHPMPLALLLLALLGVAPLTGCDDGGKGDSTSAVEAPAAPATPDGVAEEVAEKSQRREAYGLPFPPKVLTTHEFEGFVRIVTPMTLEELERFFTSRLVDFEVLREPDGVTLRVVGLRAYMPYLRAIRRRGARWSEISYFPSRETPKIAQPVEVPETDEEGRPRDPDRAKIPGTPVTLRTPDGELLAPGARWGEPYTPPKGSPLDRKRFRLNFGRPFGEWTPQ